MGSKSTTTQIAEPYAPARPYLDSGFVTAADIYDTGGFDQTPYGGQMVAGYDPMRAQADGLTGASTGYQLGGVARADATLAGAMDPNARSAAWGQIRQNTINGIMPGINSSFAGSGMTGSGLHAQNLAAGMSQGLATVENENWQQGQNRALAAAGMQPGINAAARDTIGALGAAGADRQQQSQDWINAQIMRDQQSKSVRANALQDYMALVSGASSPFGSQSSTARQGGIGGVLGGLGAGLQGAGLLAKAGGFGALFPSDRRLKEDIKRVGETDEGLPVYTYRYKAGGPVQMGVMAQDVEKVKPQAVGLIGGFKAVDYGAI